MNQHSRNIVVRLVILFGGAFAVVAINIWLVLTGHYRWPLAVLVAYLVGGPLLLRRFRLVAKDANGGHQLKTATSALLLGWSARSRDMAANPIIFHSALAPEAVADTLLRSVDKEVIGIRSLLPWFIRLLWKGGSRDVRGLVEDNTFRLKRWSAMQWSPNFYGKWEADRGGTRIEGYFGLAPTVKWSLRLTLAVVTGLAVLGIVLNTLDLTAGTHFTVDPEVGLGISIFLILLAGGIFAVAHKLGGRKDEKLLAFLEQTLAARVC